MRNNYTKWRTAVGPGWRPLMDKLVADLEALGWDGTILQVKEKFGGLRFYIGAANDKIFDRISQAEVDSYKICEECGQPGVLRGGGWLRTLCEGHAGGRKPWKFEDDVP